MSEPHISVIIPVFNDPDGIRTTLESALDQEYDDYEIIPVDNNSDDETSIIVDQYGRMHDRVRPVTESQPGSYAARNAGIEAAAGDVFVFIDADMSAPSDWLASIAAHLDREDCDYLGYAVDVYQNGDSTFWGRYDEQLALPTEQYFERKHFSPTCAVAVRSWVFDELGGFISTLQSGGDKEFGIRCWRHEAVTCDFTADIVVRHPARTTARSQFSKAKRVGSGLVDLAMLGVDDGDESPWPIPDYVLPPDPRRVRETMDSDSYRGFASAYLADTLVSYAQVMFGGLYFLRNRGQTTVGAPAPVTENQ